MGLHEHREILLSSMYDAESTLSRAGWISPQARIGVERIISRIIDHRGDVSLAQSDPRTEVSYNRDATNTGSIDPRRRYSLTLGRFIARKLATVDRRIALTPPNVLAEFVELTMRNVSKQLGVAKDDNTVFTIYRGNDISREYKLAQEWASSCMSGTGSVYTKFYDANPEKIGLVVMSVGSNKVARALLWKVNDKLQVVDRVFPDSHTKLFKDWAVFQSIKTVVKFTPEYKAEGKITITDLNVSKPEIYPYLDTFIFTSDGPGHKTISINNYKGDYSLQSQHGQMYNQHDCKNVLDVYIPCTHCDTLVAYANIWRNHAGNIYCSGCYNKLFFRCAYCSNEFDRENDMRSVNSKSRRRTILVCTGCLKTYYLKCDDCGGVFGRKHLHRNGDGNFCGSCVDPHKCKMCRTFPKEKLVKGHQIDGNSISVCPACAERMDAINREIAESKKSHRRVAV